MIVKVEEEAILVDESPDETESSPSMDSDFTVSNAFQKKQPPCFRSNLGFCFWFLVFEGKSIWVNRSAISC